MKIVIIRTRIQTFDSSRPGFLYTRVSLERGLTCETKRDVATRSSEALSRRSRTPARSSGVGIKVTRAKGLGSPVRKALALTLQLYLSLSSCTERRKMFDVLRLSPGKGRGKEFAMTNCIGKDSDAFAAFGHLGIKR